MYPRMRVTIQTHIKMAQQYHAAGIREYYRPLVELLKGLPVYHKITTDSGIHTVDLNSAQVRCHIYHSWSLLLKTDDEKRAFWAGVINRNLQTLTHMKQAHQHNDVYMQAHVVINLISNYSNLLPKNKAQLLPNLYLDTLAALKQLGIKPKLTLEMYYQAMNRTSLQTNFFAPARKTTPTLPVITIIEPDVPVTRPSKRPR